MPINKYYSGHGSEVMKNMTEQYGAKKGKQIFYATAASKKQRPEDHSVSGLKRAKP